VIARDEAETLPRCLESVEELVDAALVIDTGSEDDTVEVARSHGAHVLERRWHNFAHNRTELLIEAGNHGDRILMLDADMVVDAGGTLPDQDADVLMAAMRFGSLRYRLPFLVAASKPWRYEGAAHAYLTCDEPATRADTDAFTVTHFGAGATREKIERDLELLQAEVGSPRSLFYLAQSYKDLGQWDQAIRHYRARAALAGWDEERWYALYQAGALLCRYVSFAEGAPLLLEAWRMRPHRAEPLRALGHSAHGVADKIPLPTDSLFVDERAYKTDAGLEHDDGWMLPDDFLDYVTGIVRLNKIGKVLECGSGRSTVRLAATGAKVVSLEHDARFAARTRKWLDESGLYADVRHAPIVDGWYDPSAWRDLDGIGLLLVDGPPGALSPLARAPALPLLAPRLAPGCYVILDDTHRDDEKQIVSFWTDNGLLSHTETVVHAKGEAVIGRYYPRGHDAR
jgi:tetratricopeptide (TPR) repeat protein